MTDLEDVVKLDACFKLRVWNCKGKYEKDNVNGGDNISAIEYYKFLWKTLQNIVKLTLWSL